LGTELTITTSSHRRLWIAAAILVLATGGITLLLLGPFLEARFELARRGIASAEYPGALHEACARDDTETLALLRDARVDLDQPDAEGSTPLHTAVSAGAGRAVEMLLEGGADQQLLDADGYPPLSLALRRDDTAIARLFLEHRGSPLVPLGKDRQPAPFEAVATGSSALLGLLLAYDLDANAADQQGVSLLAHAIKRADYKMIEMLLRHGANASAAISPGISYLAYAARNGDIKLAELLLDHGADVDAAGADGISPLATAIDEGKSGVARLLLERGARVPPARPDAPGLLHRAAEQDDIDIARLLLEHGADIETPFPDGTRLIEYAVDTDKLALFRLLLEHGAKADGLAIRALRQGRTEILSRLLDGSAFVDTMIDGQPAFEWAVRNASPELVGVLLAHGADPEILGREGQSMLALAVALDRPEVVATLADHGADIDARIVSPVLDVFADLFNTPYARRYLTKDRGLTPLMLAVLRGRRDTVHVLLERNARMDTPTSVIGTWPIGLAAHQKDVPMMQLLLGRDPDPAKQRRQILVSLADQTAVLYVDGSVQLKTRVSTGREGYETPPGKYVITNKYRRWTSTLYDASMPYFLRLNASAVGLHEGVVPSHPASHGCIRVPRGTAQQLFASTRVGDPVTIVKGSLTTAGSAYFSSAYEPTPD
jgi:ankyrin repeat protein